MLDQQTHSHWSHIRGEAMQGEMLGAKLTMLSSEMTTWDDWRARNPDTTVLDLSRTAERFTREFYKDPAEFVYGWSLRRKRYHLSMDALVHAPLQELNLRGEPLLLVFDSETTGVRLLSRVLDGRTLTFVPAGDDRMRDQETNSTWDAYAGRATAGPLKGKALDRRLGMLSYKRAWNTFYPKCMDLGTRP